MPDLVSDTTSFSCPFCTCKPKLKVPQSSAQGDGKILANTNNSFFPPPGGQCTVIPSAPVPCVPSVTVVDPGQQIVQIDGKTALGAGCKFMCAKGGVLTVSSSGQTAAQHEESILSQLLPALLDLALVVASRGRKKPSEKSLLTGVKLLRALRSYLSKVKFIKKEQLVKDLESIGLKYKGGSSDGKFMHFNDKKGRLRVKIDPPDGYKTKSNPDRTDYDHIHIFDKKGNPLDKSLKIGKKEDRDVHIEYGGD